MSLMLYFKRRVAVLATGPLGQLKGEVVEPGEPFMPIGSVPEHGLIQGMTYCGLVRVDVADLSPAPRPTSEGMR